MGGTKSKARACGAACPAGSACVVLLLFNLSRRPPASTECHQLVITPPAHVSIKTLNNDSDRLDHVYSVACFRHSARIRLWLHVPSPWYSFRQPLLCPSVSWRLQVCLVATGHERLARLLGS